MPTLQEIKEKIVYVEGPHGQRVVTVPIKHVNKEENTVVNIWVVIVVLMFVAPICLILGLVYGRFVFFVKNAKKNSKYDDFYIAAISLSVIGVIFVVAIVALMKYLKVRKLRVMRHHYHQELIDEEGDLEEYGARFVERRYNRV